jgi:hypothetical protein
VPYGYAVSELLKVLNSGSPQKVSRLGECIRRVEAGLLPVGLKIHCLDRGSNLARLIDKLGGRKRVLELNSFRETNASFCLVLPPVGSTKAAVLLLDCIQEFTGQPILGSPRLQLQICSPGRLTPTRSALLAIAFYLGSDTLRRYKLAELDTTFSHHGQHTCGRRIVLYDASGEFDRDFDWWGKDDHRTSSLPMDQGRTDLLAGTASALDIENINLVASLLAHAQFRGRWEELGMRFEADMTALLERHILSGLLTAPWVHQSDPVVSRDLEFYAALQELTAYAFEEAVRVRRPGLLWSRVEDIPQRKSHGILPEVQRLLKQYREELTRQAVHPGRRAS